MVASTYEDDSRLTALTYPDGRQIDYTYDAEDGLNDALSRIAQIKEDDGSVKTLADYKHLGLGMKVLANYVEGGVRYDIWGSSVGSYAGLDQFDRIDKLYWITDGSPDVVECLLEYGYNRNSLPTSCKDASSTTNNSHDYDALYGRDKLERLNDYTRGEIDTTTNPPTIPSVDATYRQKQALDRVANWKTLDQDNTGDGSSSWDLVQTRTHSSVNEITGITNTTGGAWDLSGYDASGNTTTMPSPIEPDVNADTLDATYDPWNRLVKLVNNNDPEPETVGEYRYDARGFRIVRKRYTAGTHSATWHDYFTSSWQCIEEREDDPTNEDPPQLRTQYLWGLRYIDDLIQRKRDTTGNGSLDEVLYALNDRQYNVIALADPTTTTTSIVQRIVTTPYGTPTFLTATYGSSTNTKDWQHLFQGLRTDEESGLIQNRHRVLHPVLGRFLQRDPLGYPDGMNAYAAYHVMRGGVDPMGLSSPTTSLLGFIQAIDNALQENRDRYDIGENKGVFEKGLEALSKISEVISEKCEECCDKDSERCCPDKCKERAQAIEDAILLTWYFTWGQDRGFESNQAKLGTPSETTQRCGGYFCYVWSRLFRNDILAVDGRECLIPKEQLYFYKGFKAKDPETGSPYVHAYVEIFVCGKRTDECRVMIDDGFLEDGFVHTPPWPVVGNRPAQEDGVNLIIGGTNAGNQLEIPGP